MKTDKTVKELFDLAIQAEKIMRDYYIGLTEKFQTLPDVVNFWQGLANDENGHIRWLENVCSKLPQEKLSSMADPEVITQAERALQFSVEKALDETKTLKDAYEFAHELEYSETNAIFRFLMQTFIGPAKRQQMALQEIENHLEKLMDFSKTFGDRLK